MTTVKDNLIIGFPICQTVGILLVNINRRKFGTKWLKESNQADDWKTSSTIFLSIISKKSFIDVIMSNSNSNVVIPQDMVTLHCIERGKTVPSLSPFVLKLETFLRMANISYQVDTKKPFSAKSKKTPWITLNGMDLSDSQIIMDHLTTKFNINLWGGATEEEKATARLTRLAIEEHFIWGIVHWRWVKSINSLGDLSQLSALKLKVLKLVLPRRIKKNLYAQGLGRHPYDTMVQIFVEDLRNLNTILGRREFWLGIYPTEIDCAIFGFLAQVLWAMPGSPYEILLKEELSNLEDYCIRMRNKFWPDFETILCKINN